MLAALKARFNGADDFCLRELTAGGQVLYALFLDGMTSGSDISDFVVRGRIGTYRGDEPGCLDVSRLGERYRDKAGGGVLPQVRMRPCRPPEFRRGHRYCGCR